MTSDTALDVGDPPTPATHSGDDAADARDAAASGRDQAALARDVAAEARDAATAALDHGEAAGNRAFAAGDRAAAALDRQDSASDRLDAADRLRHAYRDQLTGLLLRDPGRDLLRQSVNAAHRTGERLVVAFLDVDGLKRVNDADGHAAGDDLLRAVGVVLRQKLRSYDVAVRYGGDEFVCALAGAGIDDAVERLLDVARYLSATRAGATVSVGLAQLLPNEALEHVLERADDDMYARRRARAAGSAAQQR